MGYLTPSLSELHRLILSPDMIKPPISPDFLLRNFPYIQNIFYFSSAVCSTLFLKHSSASVNPSSPSTLTFSLMRKATTFKLFCPPSAPLPMTSLPSQLNYQDNHFFFHHCTTGQQMLTVQPLSSELHLCPSNSCEITSFISYLT